MIEKLYQNVLLFDYFQFCQSQALHSLTNSKILGQSKALNTARKELIAMIAFFMIPN